MKIMKEQTIRELTVGKVLCNKCGKSVEPMSYCASVSYSGGYESNQLVGIADGDSFSFELCESCLASLMLSFKVPTTYRNYLYSVHKWSWYSCRKHASKKTK